MCTCASCKATDRLSKAGFTEWPKGEPAGPRTSAAIYAAHVAHVWKGMRKTLTAGSPFPGTGTPALDPHKHYQFEGSEYYTGEGAHLYSSGTRAYRHFQKTAAGYVAEWIKLNHLAAPHCPKAPKL